MEEFQENDIKDRYILLHYFPEELWEKILKKVKTSGDFLALINSSLFFRNILLPIRVQCLFPQVWHIFKQDLYINSKILRATQPITTCTDCSRIRKIRHWSSILTLRLVCKIWRDSVDNFYQSHENNSYKFSHENQPDGKTWDFVKWTNQEFHTNTHNFPALGFLRHFEGIHSNNPFLARAATFPWKLFNDNGRVDENSQILQIISKYGHHLWYCTLEISNDQYHTHAFYQNLALILKYLPNVRCLKIVYKGQMHELHVSALQDIPNITIPKLGKLTWLSTYNLPLVILRDLLVVNHTISVLEINSEQSIPFYYSAINIPQIEFSNLKEFSARNISETDFLSLSRCRNIWALRKVYLEFRPGFWLEWSKVFKLLEEKWGKTLINVGIVLPSTIEDKIERKIIQECNSYELNLPKLKHLTLVFKNICTLDFILPMKEHLETLEIHIEFPIERWGIADDKMAQRLKESQTIQYLGYVNRLFESNIWTLFPKLIQVICLEKYDSNRDNEGFAMFRHVYIRKEWCDFRK